MWCRTSAEGGLMLDRPDQLEREARRRERKRARDRRHRERLSAGIVMVTLAADCELTWLRRTQWLVGPREGRAEIESALTRLLADSAQRS
jgi:hypothetical protein